MDQDKRIKLYLFGGFVALMVAIVAFGIVSLVRELKKTGGGHGEAAVSAAPAAAVAAAVPAASKPAGQVLMEKNDCMTCHRIDSKLIGPSYREVSAKYKGADEAKIMELVGRVKAGGQGVWGQVPMTPHPNLSDKDGRAIVEWVLSLAE